MTHGHGSGRAEMATTFRYKPLLLLGLCLGLALAGCGRKGSLETPGAPSADVSPAADPALAVVETPSAEPENGESFFLDFLIR